MLTELENPEFILFIQHGWKDIAKSFNTLAESLKNPKMKIFIPDLGYFDTWLNIDKLIKKLEIQVLETIEKYPHSPIKIIAHSLGGIIWLELLQLHPEWLPKIENIILLGSPIGGADMARIIDPFGKLPTIARDLGKNRRELAQTIAQQIPCLVIVGDKDNGSDGTVVEGATHIKNAQFIRLSGLNHKDLRNHILVTETVNKYWQGELINEEINPLITDEMEQIISLLRNVEGMTDAHYRDFKYASIYLTFPSGLKLYLWKNPAQVDHVFLADQNNNCIYGGFVGWIHSKALKNALNSLEILSKKV
jgi:hypothetical protein